MPALALDVNEATTTRALRTDVLNECKHSKRRCGRARDVCRRKWCREEAAHSSPLPLVGGVVRLTRRNCVEPHIHAFSSQQLELHCAMSFFPRDFCRLGGKMLDVCVCEKRSEKMWL